MTIEIILLILYLLGTIISFYSFYIRGFRNKLLCSVLWFIVLPIGFIWGYFYDKKQNRKKPK